MHYSAVICGAQITLEESRDGPKQDSYFETLFGMIKVSGNTQRN